MPHPRSVFAVLAVVCALAAAAFAQCTPQWLPGPGRPTPAGGVTSSAVWDPDGAGPAPTVLVVGGKLDGAESLAAPLLTFDGTQWAPLGGLTGRVTALAVYNGTLHAAVITTGGAPPFTFTTFTVQARVGAAWQVIGSTGTAVNAMTNHGGQLVIGGNFTSVSGVPANGVAAWNGTTWSSFGAGVQGTVRALASFNGSLYAGGLITSAGSVAAGNLAQWNGSVWSSGPLFNADVNALAVRSGIAIGQSFLFVGGDFTSYAFGPLVFSALRIARYEPTANVWSSVGGGLPGTRCTSLLVRSTGINGFEVAAGIEDASNTDRMWRFASGAWSALGSVFDSAGPVRPTTITFFGGRYTIGLNDSTRAVRNFDGTSWQDVLGQGINGFPYTIEPRGSDLVIAGAFLTISGVTVNGIARGSAGAWSPLGTGLQGGIGALDLTTAANGDLIAAGQFTTAGSVPCNHIARWNGSAWAPLGAGLGDTANAALALPNGEIIAAGDFATAGGVPCNRIARWNGSTWSPLGTGLNARAYALALLQDGSIVAAGQFTTAGGIAASRIARFHNGVWSALGSGCNNQVYALAVAPNGDLHVGGIFTTAGGITTRVARWRNNVWSSTATIGITTQPVMTLAVHPNGDLFIGGDVFSFSLGPFGGWASPLVRTTASGSMTPMPVVGTSVLTSAITPDGDLAIGGLIDTVGGLVSASVARLDATCPAGGAPYGAGCNGLTAPLSLTMLEAPWIGGAWRLRASTFGPTGFALRVVGFAQVSVPLPPVLPGSLPGCTLLAAPDFTEVLLASQGTVTTTTAMPMNTTLIGIDVFEQVLQLESAGTGFAISASNGMHLVVGSF